MSQAPTPSDNVQYIQLRGSSTVLRIMQSIGLQYMDEHPDVRLPLVGGGTSVGYKSVLDGSCDIGMASGQCSPEIDVWAEKNKYAYEAVTIAVDGIAAIVNPANPIADLSLDQLHDIFTGKITSWSQVGKHSGLINVVSHNPQLGTYDPWKRQVAGKDYITLRATVVSGHQELFRLISADKNAIGYVSATFLKNATVKAVAINGYLPSYQNIKSESYPVRNPLQLLTRPSPSAEIKGYLAYCLDVNKGQALIKSAGLVPVNGD
jgi:phosphate transport system substrate-binding protein